MQKGFSGRHAHLPRLRPFSGHHVWHAPCMSGLQVGGIGGEARLRAHPGHAGRRWRGGNHPRFQADQICCRRPQEPRAKLHEASAKGGDVIVAASGNGRLLRIYCNCTVQDLTPKCMHWITVLGNVVLPSIKRTREEIRTGKIRQFKARMCLVAYEAGQIADTRSRWPRVDLVQEPLLPRQPVRSCLRGDSCAEPIWGVERGKYDFPVVGVVQTGCVCRHPELRRQHPAPPHGGKGHGRRKPTPPCDQAEGSGIHQVYPTRLRISSRSNSWLQSAGMERLLQSLDWPGVGGLASSQSGTSVPWSTMVWISLRHRGGEPLAWWILIHLRRGSFALCEVSHSGSCCLLWCWFG